MAAFDKIKSGIPQFDTAIDYIRLGDNVVWLVDTIDTFLKFALPYVNQAIKDHRNLIYIRFAEHAPFLTTGDNLKIYEVNPEERFELFTVKIHEIVEREGRDAFYLFDCLSELQVAWSTDLMIVYVDPKGYYNLPYKEKPYVANIIGKINQRYSDMKTQKVLITPGRIGTSSPELGVPVSFGQISNFQTVCEMAYSKAGYRPELSYGSHMFQDLVEASILYVAIMENHHTKVLQSELLDLYSTDIFQELFPEEEELNGIIRVYPMTDSMLYHDYQQEKTILQLQI